MYMLQEQFIKVLADMLFEGLDCEGCGVIVKGRHNCMRTRGIRQPNSEVTMAELRGTFLSDPSVKDEFYKIIKL